MGNYGLFKRYKDNPILTAGDWPYPANSVFNPAAVIVDGETLLLVRVEDHRGFSHLTVARSKNGYDNWEIDPHPTFTADPENYPEEEYGIEDARITYVEDEKQWYIAYTSFSSSGPLPSMARTRDFKTFERIGSVLPPENKDAALFPVRFEGRWALIHRPVAGGMAKANMWISFSTDMKQWGEHQVLLHARDGGWWDANKIGLSPQPLRTDKGWLVMYHGVRHTEAKISYKLGLALLDLEDPTVVLKRADEWLFGPRENYERVGDVNEVVFPCGWVLEGDEVRMYYGGADTCVAVATASLEEILDYMEKW
ncbi:glycosidase [Methanolobus chelungpuianus]|uniref:Glycosidase n=1 Tax=Methanolobus chelungpuianus TaxID=502115 RepID=A0AAE3HBC9_9EURY|nr:glycosidase [Methanolobus chelungpuianus]